MYLQKATDYVTIDSTHFYSDKQSNFIDANIIPTLAITNSKVEVDL